MKEFKNWLIECLIVLSLNIKNQVGIIFNYGTKSWCEIKSDKKIIKYGNSFLSKDVCADALSCNDAKNISKYYIC